MKATRRSNQYSVCDDTVKQQTKAIYISTNTYHFNNPVTDQSREVSELTDTRAQHQLKMGGRIQTRTCENYYLNKYFKFTSEMSHIC